MKRNLLGILTLVSSAAFSQIQTGYFNTMSSYVQVVSSYTWDMNKDGIDDYRFSLDYDTLTGQAAHVTPLNGSKIEIVTANEVRNVASGSAVGTGTWSSTAARISYGSSGNPQSGSFGDATANGFLGVKVTAGGKVYIGWIKIAQFDGATQLYTFAYNKVSGQGIKAGQTNPTGISEIEASNFKIGSYNGILKIETVANLSEKTQLIVSNMNGQSLISKEIVSGVTDVALSDFAKGMYIVAIFTAEKKVLAQLITNE